MAVYLGWVTIATAINYAIWRDNTPKGMAWATTVGSFWPRAGSAKKGKIEK